MPDERFALPMNDTLVTTTPAPEPLDPMVLQRLKPIERLQAIISREDAQNAVRSLQSYTLYHLVREIGREDALELIHLASPEQLQTFVDIDCWQRDRFNPGAIMPWIDAFWLETPDASFKEAIKDIDLEPLVLTFKEHMLAFVIEDPDDLPKELLALERPYETLDGVYALVFGDNEDATRSLRQLLKRLYELDRKAAWTILESCRWELTSTMEEAAYQARTARLGELGFVEMGEALEIFANRDPATLRRTLLEALEGHQPEVSPSSAAQEGTGLFMVPDLFAAPLDQDETFFGTAWRRLMTLLVEGQIQCDLQSMSFAMVALTNRAIAAEAVDPHDLEASRQVYQRVLGNLNIALEFMAQRDVEVAARMLSVAHPLHLFQAGHSVVVKLAVQARALLAQPAMATALTLVDEAPYGLLGHNDRLLASALNRPRPLYHDPGRDYVEPFQRLEQVERAAVRLSRLAFKLTAVFGILRLERGAIAQVAYRDDVHPPVEALHLDALLHTIIARVALGEPPILVPLSVNQVASLIEGPIATSLKHRGALEQSPLMTAAHAVLVNHDGLDAQAQSVGKALSVSLTSELIDALGALNPADIRSGATPVVLLGELLLTCPHDGAAPK